MRFINLFLILGVLLSACQQNPRQDNKKTGSQQMDSTDATNDFYDNAPTYRLNHEGAITVRGEVAKEYNISFEGLPLRSVLVKETLLKHETDSFVGAYQYHGYSLYDLLNRVRIQKANQETFSPIIDLFIEIHNAKGEKVVFSWGELFYPNNRHQILVATRVTPIIPSKTKDQWPLPEDSRIVVATDLLNERNIRNPTRVVIRTLKGEFPEKEQEKLYAPSVALLNLDGKKIDQIGQIPSGMEALDYPTVFYGRGRGIHGVSSFSGFLLKDLIRRYFPVTKDRLQKGYFSVAAPDGYRAAFTYSEIFNRNDQSEVLLMDLGKEMPDGRFRVFHSADFFSDRAIKAVSEIQYREIE